LIVVVGISKCSTAARAAARRKFFALAFTKRRGGYKVCGAVIPPRRRPVAVAATPNFSVGLPEFAN
jgi:hypothetical protein